MGNVRKEWLERMLRIAAPVMDSLAEGKLHCTLPNTWHPDRKPYAMLEALGRTLEGIAPWLELDGLSGEEKDIQAQWREKTRRAVSQAVDPQSADYMNFREGYGQALVDAAFLAHGIVRAPRELGEKLSPEAREHLIAALRDTRRFTPFVSNWILFSAMVESALEVLHAGDADMTRVDYAVQMFERWYCGDGTYGDGDRFHWDYYNSFVIQPMLVDILHVFREKGRDYAALEEKAVGHASRYAQVLEQMIHADGTWTVIGRSTVYRFGAFQALSQAALEHFLPEQLPASQVRCALTAAIRRGMQRPETFDENGFLRPGVDGFQPSMAEDYISVGSLYLCEAVFLPLGLPETDPFWSGEDLPWTDRKIWSGIDTMRDHAVD